MQTTLERINDQVETKIAAVESGTEFPVMPGMESESIAGFAIPEVLLRPRHEAAVTEMALKQISEYRRLAAELRVKLMEAGVVPLAILPAKAWYELCDRSGLYLLFPNKHGGVALNSDVVQRLRAESATLVDWCVGVVVGFLVTAASYASLSYSSMDASVLATMALALGALAMWVGVRASCVLLKDRRFARNARDYLASRSWAEVLADLAPSRRIYGGNDWHQTKLELPAPPVSVAEILIRAQRGGLTLRIAAEADAVSFQGGVEKMLGDEYRRMLRAEEAIRRDPIVFIDYGGKQATYVDNSAVIAVIAQFGDFPIEQKVLNEVVGRGVL